MIISGVALLGWFGVVVGLLLLLFFGVRWWSFFRPLWLRKKKYPKWPERRFWGR
jgi:hypothetical protein